MRVQSANSALTRQHRDRDKAAVQLLSSPHEKTCSCSFFWLQAKKVLPLVGYCMKLPPYQEVTRKPYTSKHGNAKHVTWGWLEGSE